VVVRLVDVCLLGFELGMAHAPTVTGPPASAPPYLGP
jgi:hypothetical protein